MIMKEIKILDLFCCEGGASMGYFQGFKKHGFNPVVVGVDISPQPRYPFKFIQGDAIEYLVNNHHTYGLIVASPPCQNDSVACKRFKNQGKVYPDLIAKTREALKATGKPYVIENVQGAKSKLVDPILICGLMVGMSMYRHRLFETWCKVEQPNHPQHVLKSSPMGRKQLEGHFIASPVGNVPQTDLVKRVMGVTWMSQKGLSQSIPPAYTELITDLIVHNFEFTEKE